MGCQRSSNFQEKWTCQMEQSLHASKKEPWIERIRCLQKRNSILQGSHETLQKIDSYEGKEVNECKKIPFLLGNKEYSCEAPYHTIRRSRMSFVNRCSKWLNLVVFFKTNQSEDKPKKSMLC